MYVKSRESHARKTHTHTHTHTLYVESLAKLLVFPGESAIKNLPANAEDTRYVGLIPGWGRSPGEGSSNQL